MEQVCNICGMEKDDVGERPEKNVIIICDKCLKNDDCSSVLEHFFK